MPYIDRDTAIRTAIETCVQVAGHGITQIDAVNIANAFEDIPAADVVKVKHGTWQKSQFAGRSGFYSLRDVICSECGIYSTFLQHEIRPDYYCPNCGAKMDGRRRE